MKKIFIFFLISSFQIYPQLKSITGIVIDSDSKSLLQYANVVIKGTNLGSATNEKGKFTVTGDFGKYDTLVISFVGYKKFEKIISEIGDEPLNIELQKITLPSQTVLVEASIGKKGVTPIAFEKIKKEEIEKDYIVQDIPNYLSQLPSTTFYSENGNGIGYNYLSIRGFDQRRISVSINGIPQNDPEDHNVYWLDFPDLLASSELIQVQRGAGSGVIGYPAVGGSINIITSPFSERVQTTLHISYGSFGTKKFSASFSSGLIKNKYSIYAKLSQIQSSGYRNLSWSKLNSFHISAVRYDDQLTTQFNFYGGPISDGLAYTGIAKFAIRDKQLRKENYSYWEANETGYNYTLDRKPTEIENFSQPHFELLNEYKLNDKTKLNSAFFLVLGSGFFDYDGSWSVFYDDYFRLKLNGYDTLMIPTNAIIRAEVNNKQFGWIPKLSIEHANGNLVVGGEFRIHRSEHFGNINFAENLPFGVTKDYRYYFYNGAKNIFSGFVHEAYDLTKEINLLGEIQLAFHKYKLYNEKYLGNDFSLNDLFINPRFGINYKFTDQHNVFLSFARVTREPLLKNYYDAAESSAGETPQFEINSDGTYNYNLPLVKPETMNDMEIGTSFNNSLISVNLNLYYMLFENEIVKNGKVDRFGQPITGNVDQTKHYGIEVNCLLKILNGVELFGSASYSQNKITNGKYFISNAESIEISNNNISCFPEFLFNLGAQYNNQNLFIKLTSKYVGKFYSDNFDSHIKKYLTQFPGFIDYTDNVNEAYFAMDLYASYETQIFNGSTNSKIFVQLNNIFDNLYSAYAIGKEFFPSAERNFIAGVQIGL